VQKIKIYGESKTGTSYLAELIRENTQAEVLEGNPDSPLGWKHGFPQPGGVHYVFLFRNVFETVKSLKADGVDKRFKGLESEFGGIEYPFWHRWENYLECRKAKYYAYLGFAFLYPATFLSYKSLPVGITKLENHGIRVKHPIKDFDRHVYRDYEGKENPKRQDLTESEVNFINKHKDVALEQFVDGL